MLVIFGAASPCGNSETVVTYTVGLAEQPPDVQVSALTAYVVAGSNDVTVVRFELAFSALQIPDHTNEINFRLKSGRNFWFFSWSSYSLSTELWPLPKYEWKSAAIIFLLRRLTHRGTQFSTILSTYILCRPTYQVKLIRVLFSFFI